MSELNVERPLGPAWRAERERAQETSLPTGRFVVSCAAPFSSGGLGRHLQEIVHALERRGQPNAYICGPSGQSASGSSQRPKRPPSIATAMTPLARISPAWRIWKARVEFDAHAARGLLPADHLIAFNRQALTQFRAARRMGYQSVSLMSGSPHVRRVARQHGLAYRQYPLERSFGTHIVKRYLREYAQADRIYAASRYTWESFLEQGISEERLSLFPLIPDPRYEPDVASGASATFDIVYIGSLTVAKGVPLLVDAVRRLSYPELRLILIGGWKSRGMRRFIGEACAGDSRLQVRPGDPLAHLRRARLCIHPTYEDGFAYAPAEALACGVPVIVSEDTGMKELIDPDRNGVIVPTGSLEALTQAIEAAYRGELLRG